MSFDGEVEDLRFISIDNFTDRSKYAYFLSHYHSDHFKGLDDYNLPRALKNNKAVIYASEVTIAIIKNEQSWALFPYLRTLKLGRNTVTITANSEEIHLTVTALPAGHSLGSIMFLFEHKNKTILFTGDFRITPNDITKYTHLHRNKEPIKIDVLYVDTTFQNVPFFPRRSEVVANVIDIIKNWLDSDKENVVNLKTSANYGYEYVCNEIYSALKIKCYLGREKWNVFSQFPKEVYGITDDASTRIRMCYFKSQEQFSKSSEKILNIFFSAMSWQNENKDEEYIKMINENYYKVCFSTHCGRNELLHFINYLQPKKIVGFPEPWNSTSPVKLVKASSPLKIQISSCKRTRKDSDGDKKVEAKKLSTDKVKKMFDW